MHERMESGEAKNHNCTKLFSFCRCIGWTTILTATTRFKRLAIPLGGKVHLLFASALQFQSAGLFISSNLRTTFFIEHNGCFYQPPLRRTGIDVVSLSLRNLVIMPAYSDMSVRD
jgi:hypothetical protein